jgi:hypothetical protein
LYNIGQSVLLADSFKPDFSNKIVKIVGIIPREKQADREYQVDYEQDGTYCDTWVKEKDIVKVIEPNIFISTASIDAINPYKVKNTLKSSRSVKFKDIKENDN